MNTPNTPSMQTHTRPQVLRRRPSEPQPQARKQVVARPAVIEPVLVPSAEVVPALAGLPARLANHANWIHRMVLGQAATELLAADLPGSGYLVAGATWWWTAPKVDMGRKSAVGEAGYVPVRLVWHTTCDVAGVVAGGSEDRRHRLVRSVPLQVVSDPQQMRWLTAGGMGHRAVVDRVAAAGSWLSEQVAPELGCLQRDELVAALRNLEADGNLAKWEYHHELSEFVKAAVHRAHASLCMEVSELHNHSVWRLADDTTLEQVIDLVSLGDGSTGGQVDTMLSKVTDPDTFWGVEPVHYATRWINREAKDQLRVALDDPRAGSKIRALAKEVGSRDPVVVAEAYEARYGDRVMSEDWRQSRVHRALRLGQDRPPVSIEHVRGYGSDRSVHGD